MQLEAKKHLYDIKHAGDLLAEFSAGKAFADYEADSMLRSAVERQFEIAGEALSRLARLDGTLGIPNYADALQLPSCRSNSQVTRGNVFAERRAWPLGPSTGQRVYEYGHGHADRLVSATRHGRDLHPDS